jgi:thiol-disulfide isomerase/thioredoxin
VAVTALRVLLAACVVSAALVGCTGHSKGNGKGTVQIIDVNHRVPAPSIEGPALAGGVLRSRDFVGRVLVLNYWGSWCPPCRAEQPKLNTVYNADHAKGVDFLGINIRDDNTSARTFLQNYHVQYPSIVDEPDATALQFDPRLPADPPLTIVVDKAGRIAAKILGPADIGVLQPLVEQFAAEAA